MLPNKALKSILWLILAVALLLAGCSRSAGNPSENGKPSDALLTVEIPDGENVYFTLEQMQELPITTITVEGKPEEGPSLLAALEAAGVTEFEEVTLTGNDGSITLSFDQVHDEVILDITKRDTLKFAATDVPKATWIHDVYLIEIK